MKTLKQHIKDTELDDFEEDLMAEKAPNTCLLYTSPSPRDTSSSRMPSSA